jgi:hypothetical protein
MAVIGSVLWTVSSLNESVWWKHKKWLHKKLARPQQGGGGIYEDTLVRLCDYLWKHPYL